MPELPEVETVKEGLKKIIKSQPVIEKVVVRQKKLRTNIPTTFSRKLKGQALVDVSRRAKYLIFETSDHMFINHLGMSGIWRMMDHKGEVQKHDHCLLYLSDGRCLAYNDPRRFGIMEFYKEGEANKWLSHLGPEPLDVKSFNVKYLSAKLKTRKAPIKAAIMDQKVVVGVGNIYASEALFLAGILPTRAANEITDDELKALINSIRKVLKKAIKAGGTTLKDFRQAGGETGYFQNKLYVYGRDGALCLTCHDKIQSKVIAGRNTFWCSSCQS